MSEPEYTPRSYKEAIKQILGDRPVAYHPILAHALGSVTAALFLSQIMYWSDKGSDEEGWIYKTQDEMHLETGLSRREQEGARRLLVKAKVLEERRSGIPARLFYRVCWEDVTSLIGGNVQTRMAETANQDGTKPPILDGGNRQSITYNKEYTEIITESTTERQRTKRAPPSPADVDTEYLQQMEAEHPTLDVYREHMKWHDYNEANGWRTRQGPIKDFRASFRTRLTNAEDWSKERRAPPSPNTRTVQDGERDYQGGRYGHIVKM